MAIIGFPLLSVQITKPFSRISNNFFFGSTNSFLSACFPGAFIRFAMASSPSNINNEQMYLQCDFGVGSSGISLRCDVPACCVRPLRVIPLDGYIPCCHSFTSDSHLCVVFDNPKRLSQRDPCLDMARDKQNVSGPNAKVSRTFYIVIAMSLVRWFPCIVIYCVNFLCSKCLLTYLIHLSATLRLANSLINPII